MSNRFHNKWHRVSHHTLKDTAILDAGWDPIASPDSPFKGHFILSPDSSAYREDDWSISARRGDFLNLYSWGSNGRINVHSNLYVDDNLYVTANETIGGYSETYGNISGHGNLNITANEIVGGYSETYGNIIGHSNLYITGSGAVGKDLDVYGNITGHKNLNITANETIGGNSETYGNISGHKNLNITANETIGGYSETYGNVTGHSNLYITGSGAIGNDIDVYGNITGHKNLNISGNSIITSGISGYNNLYIASSTNIGKNLTVSGDITGYSNLYISGDETVSGTSYVSGSGYVGKTLKVTSSISGYKNLYIASSTNIGKDLIVSGNAGVSGYENVKEYVHVYGEDGNGYGLLVDKNAVVSGSTEIGKANSAISDMSMAVGSGSYAGLKAYNYTNTGNVTNSLTFSATPDWAVNDVVSIINRNKYPDAVTISAINGKIVTFSTNLPFTSIIEESDFDSKCAYIISKPDKGNVDIGLGSVAEGSGASALNFAAHAEGCDTSAFGQYSHAEGKKTKAMYCAHSEGASAKATGEYSHAEGVSCESIGSRSHAEGTATSAFGYSSHAEGGETEARGRYSHTEGYKTIAYPANDDLSGHGTHAEGVQTQAGVGAVVTNFSSGLNGVGAHAEGGGTAAAGRVSHAEGLRTYASGIATHAEGLGTIAQNDAEHGEGKYNKSNKTTAGTAAQKAAGSTIHSVGIGTSSAASSRANAFEIMQNGDIYMYNVGDYDGTNPIGSNKATDTAKVINNKVDKMKSVTRQELINLRTASGLCPGQEYRITDYEATVANDTNAQAVSHPFDIIAVADSVDKLNEKVRAIRHSNDNNDYFNGCKLEAWQIWYCIDNDTNRFAWADTVNGKGVVYRMIDEWNNDVPYDFKGIQFKAYGDTDNVWRYTFDDGVSSNNTDNSLIGASPNINVCENIIKPYIISGKAYLNCIVLKGRYCSNNFFGYGCNNNTIDGGSENYFGGNCDSNYLTTGDYNSFGDGCYQNILGSGCYYNSFGRDAGENSLGNHCFSNCFGDKCYENVLGNGCERNIFTHECSNNHLGDGCMSNSFGNKCQENSFGYSCVGNLFGNDCSNNSFGEACEHNTFGNECGYILFGTNNSLKNNCRYITIESGNRCIYLNPTSQISDESYYQNVTIVAGFNNDPDPDEPDDYKTISDSNLDQDFKTVYQPASSRIISM